jgi:hypothetical protein
LPQQAGDLSGLIGPADFDTRAFDAFALKDAERVLVDDMVDIHVADFRSKFDKPGLRSTRSASGTLFDTEASREPVLSAYAQYFTRVLKAGFGVDKGVRAKIFCARSTEVLPFRLMSFELADDDNGVPEMVNTDAPELLAEMQRAADRYRADGRARQAAGLVARVYDGSAAAPTVFILKPDAIRYWTRSAALNDADEVSTDLFRMLAATAGQDPQ